MRFPILLSLILLVSPVASNLAAPSVAGLFERDNLVAWCVVPFDGKKRGPEARAEMLAKLGLRKCAYDWRAQHVAEFEEEILQYKKHGIEYFAFWSTHPKAFELFRKHGLSPQIWKTAPSPKGDTQEERIRKAAEAMLPFAKQARGIGSRFGLYNHGGWGGEPENLVAVCQYLREHHQLENVGIVYNFHHAHEHIADFKKSLEVMKPYLLCLNLNGMNEGAQPKILQLGQGQHELKMMRTIVASGYEGPIGIIGHTQDDVEERLKDNLDGLDWLVPQLKGKKAGAKPQPRTAGK